MKTLELFKEKFSEAHHTLYTVNGNYGPQYGFEGRTALRDAKKWAKDAGFTHITILYCSTKKPDKTYEL